MFRAQVAEFNAELIALLLKYKPFNSLLQNFIAQFYWEEKEEEFDVVSETAT